MLQTPVCGPVCKLPPVYVETDKTRAPATFSSAWIDDGLAGDGWASGKMGQLCDCSLIIGPFSTPPLALEGQTWLHYLRSPSVATRFSIFSKTTLWSIHCSFLAPDCAHLIWCYSFLLVASQVFSWPELCVKDSSATLPSSCLLLLPLLLLLIFSLLPRYIVLKH